VKERERKEMKANGRTNKCVNKEHKRSHKRLEFVTFSAIGHDNYMQQYANK